MLILPFLFFLGRLRFLKLLIVLPVLLHDLFELFLRTLLLGLLFALKQLPDILHVLGVLLLD